MLVHLLPLLCLFSLVSGSYKVQQSIPVYYNTLFTYNTHLPIAYASSPLVCPAEGQKTHAWLDVHKELRGDHLVKSPINVTTLQDTPCQVLCTRYWSVHDAATAISLIEADYQVEWRLDTLPGATVSYTNKISQRTYRIGFPLGQKLQGKLYMNNHVSLHVLYSMQTHTTATIEGFEVYPESILNGSCNPPAVDYPMQPVEEHATPMTFTYSVTWKEYTPEKASRWEMYLSSPHTKKHTFATINSVLILLCLSGVIGIILLKTNAREGYEETEFKYQEGYEDSTGWRLIHHDVFRRPIYGGLLAPLVGSGVQLLSCVCIALVGAMYDYYHPAQPGALLAWLICGVFPGSILGGYYSGRVYKAFRGRSWLLNGGLTAFLVPFFILSCQSVQSLIAWYQQSSLALSFSVFTAIVLLWCVMACMLLLGSYAAEHSQPIIHPIKATLKARPIPKKPWYQHPWISIGLSGILPFAILFVDFHEWLDTMWRSDRIPSAYPITALVLYAVIVAESTVIFVFLQLCTEDYHWWWTSFASGAAPALWMAGYGMVHYWCSSHSLDLMGGCVYILRMFLGCCLVGTLSGTIGFFSAYAMVKKVYSSIKVD